MSIHVLDLNRVTPQSPLSWVIQRETTPETVDADTIASIAAPPWRQGWSRFHSSTRGTSVPAHRIELDPWPTRRSITKQLLRAFVREERRGSLQVLTETLIDAITRPQVLLVDEAQRLNHEALNQLRFLNDHPDTEFALVLASWHSIPRSLVD